MPRFLPVVLALGALVLPRLGHAQAKEALTEKLSVITCNCLQEKLAAQGQRKLTKEEARTIVIQCSGVSIGKEMKSIQQVYGANAITSKQIMNQLGSEMGVQMIQSCPTFMTYSMVMAGENAPASSPTAATTGQTTGQLGALHGTDVATLDLTVGKAEKAEFVWSRHFPQDDELLAQLDKLKGRSVRVSWQEVEVLQPGTRQYRKLREITALDLL